MVELLRVVMHGPSFLLEVHEHLALLPHHACGDVVGTESIVEFSPQYLIVRGVSGGVVGPPRAGITTQLSLVLLVVTDLDWCWLRWFLESSLLVAYCNYACMSH
jgi:hypothetical protein